MAAQKMSQMFEAVLIDEVKGSRDIPMVHYGFVRVAAAVPRLRVADCDFNTDRIIGLMQRAESEQVGILLFPELCISGYTCADLFHQTTLQQGALAALARLTKASGSQFSGVLVVGLP